MGSVPFLPRQALRISGMRILFPSMTLWVFLTTATFLSGCGTMSNGRYWGQDAWTGLSWEKTGVAAYNALMDLQTLVPAAGALIFCINDFDQETSDWAVRERPIFQTQDAAITFSHVGQYTLVAEPFVAAFFTPGGEERQDWWVYKAKGLSVDAAATGVSAGMTPLLKETTHRLRPKGVGENSFPSGHTSASFAGATLANNTLNCIPMNPVLRRSVQSFNLLMATAVGWARIEAGEHFPTDVLAGAAIGHFLSRFVYGTFSGLPEETQFGLVVLPLKRGGVVSGLSVRY